MNIENPPSPEQLVQLVESYRDQHKRLNIIEEYLHFPIDYGPSDHVQHHISGRLIERRKSEIRTHILKSTIWVMLIFVFGLLGMGVKQWILQ